MEQIDNCSTLVTQSFENQEYIIDICNNLNMANLETNDYIIDYDSKLTIEEEMQKIIIVIDNDECIGSWADLSLLYSIFKYEFKREPDIDIFVKIMKETYCIRPYVKELFEKITYLRDYNFIYKIFMCTAAPNKEGWVTFLLKILERWFGQKIYDEIIYGEMIEEWHIFNKSNFSNNEGYIKNMDMIREIIDFKYNSKPENYTVIAIDDRPNNIENGIAIGVTPYRVAINIFGVLQLFYPEKSDYLMGKYYKIINDSWEKYLNDPFKYSKMYSDRDIFEGINSIEKIIFNT